MGYLEESIENMGNYDSQEDTKKHIEAVGRFIEKFRIVLILRAIEHDKSKLISPEKEIFDEYTPKLKGSTYGSDEYKTFLKEMGIALDHHYKENRHHPEHFKNGISDMDLIDLVEMICDWKAATLRHENGAILKSIEINKERFELSDQLTNILINTVKDLDW